MKRFFLSLICLLLIGVQYAYSDQVSPSSAKKFALEYINPMSPGITVKDIRCISENEIPLYYVINFEPEGWALISAQDAVRPVIGYNLTGRFDGDESRVNLSEWLRYCSNQIVDAVKCGDKPNGAWNVKSRPVTRATSSTSKIDPLIKVHWNQTAPYNNYCPEDSKGRSIVGCVAVGMAQAMTVAKWPSKPSGTHSYVHPDYGTIYIDYSKEKTYNWNTMLPGDNEDKDQIARFLYQCGVAVDMNYGTDGSGTRSSKVSRALVDNFGYSPKTIQFLAKSNYTSEQWKEIILNELKAGRAVVYSGTDTKGGYGHCFNIDGYDGDSYFHVNWGWGGTGDGYFSLDLLRDVKMNMNYDSGHDITIGIRKPSTAPIGISLTSLEVQGGQPKGTAFAEVVVESEMENQKYTLEISGTYNPVTGEYKTVPFEINSNGEVVTTEVLTIGKEYMVIITATSKKKEQLEQQFKLTVVKETEVSAVEITPVSQEYYSLNGVYAGSDESSLSQGIYIVVKHLSDGTVLRNKVVLR